jgi:sulfide:quinone oxidoreductase
MSHVLILGGGFGGLAAAHELRTLLPDDEITLIDRNDHFYMGFAKLWDLAEIRPLSAGTASLTGLSRQGVTFRQADISSIDPEGPYVETSDETLEADALLIALGAAPAPRHVDLLSAPGAYDLYDGAELAAIRHSLDGIQQGSVLISILGLPFKCPPAPFEAALMVDERLRRLGVRDAVRVSISTPQPMTLPVAGRDASQYVAGHLEERSIELLSEHVVAEVNGDQGVVRFEGGAEYDYEVLLGVPATAPPPVISGSAVASSSGWIEPDPHTLQTSFDWVWAVGDCTAIPTAKGQLPKAGVFAEAEARVAARNIAAELGRGASERFDGHGFCFLELPGKRVAYVEGDFYAEQGPDVQITQADEEQFRRKQEYERTRLADWLEHSVTE